jgi:hypothetical protein
MATATDVARAVERAAGEELARRRRELADLMTGRAVLAGSETPPPLSTATGEGAPARSSTLTGASNAAAARAASRAPWIALAVAVIVISGLVAALVARRQNDLAAAPLPPSSTPAPASTPAVAPAASTVRVRVLSKAPLSAITAPGLVELRIEEGGATFGLPRSSEPVTLSVSLASGRALRESLTPEADTVIDLREGDAVKPDANKRAAPVVALPRSAPKPKGDDAPTGLKPSPY